ncbi:MAG: hypothetical protein K0Q50_2140 [Vampirovibrio sp.]|jgi:hypothetical protein|nr:hypothetical protein [Vampirovibrio sp.]
MLHVIHYLWGFYHCTGCLLQEEKPGRCIWQLSVGYLSDLVPGIHFSTRGHFIKR